ncbi:hypothetical protein MTP99_000831 [Tenebrio molitor]|nr:hypothetical protein MTP99_000831 [Tenebrio molitor]CAH1364451.1 unnamed protein product [Tenebrio molitor]
MDGNTSVISRGQYNYGTASLSAGEMLVLISSSMCIKDQEGPGWIPTVPSQEVAGLLCIYLTRRYIGNRRIQTDPV